MNFHGEQRTNATHASTTDPDARLARKGKGQKAKLCYAGHIDGRTTRHPGYLVSQTKRKLIEEIFGWLKTVGLMRQVRHRGTARVGWPFTFAIAVYDLIRIRTSRGRRRDTSSAAGRRARGKQKREAGADRIAHPVQQAG